MTGTKKVTMETNKVQVKLFATERLEESLESYIPVFHRWIREELVADELLIDVADYTHVPKGIGVVLIGHGADYSIDQGDGRPGLLFSRKRALPEGKGLVSDALARALDAARLIESDSEAKGPRGFSSTEILFRFVDRLHLKNDDECFANVRPALEAALAGQFPNARFTLVREGEAREPLTVRARA